MWSNLGLVCLGSLLIHLSVGHLCLITPRQRGDMDISKGGSPTCFRHGPPCGGQPPGPHPPVSLQGGQPIFIKWQQNYNHYTVGYPGYMDIAIAPASDVDKIGRMTGDPFEILAVVVDKFEYDQAHQRNYTAVVNLPNKGCDHCIIRARYVAHKPGETTFYQCADVKITETTTERQYEKMGHIQLMPNMTSHLSNPTTLPLKPFSPRIENEMGDTHLMSILTKKIDETYNESIEYKTNDFQNYDPINLGEEKLKEALHFTQNHERGITADELKNHIGRFNIIPPGQIDADKTKHENANRDNVLPSDTPETSYRKPVSSDCFVYGMSNDIDSPGGATLVAMDTRTGIRHDIGPLTFRVDSPFQDSNRFNSIHLNSSLQYVTDGVLTLDTARGVAVMPMNRHDNMDAIADTVIEMDTRSGNVKAVYNVTNGHHKPIPLKSAFSAAIVEIESSYVTFNIEPDEEKAGKFYFVVGRLFVGGSWEMLSKTDQPEDTYVNFMWADYDISVKTLYVLLGNENDALGLSARLYKFFVMPGPPLPPSPDFYSYKQLDVSKYPFMAFQFHPYHSNLLYAVSPGLHNATYPSYHLVVVDVDMGTVKEEMQVTPPGIFERFYGGAIINGIDRLNNKLLHVLRIAHTQADVIATIDVIKMTTSFSQVTNLRNVYSLYAL